MEIRGQEWERERNCAKTCGLKGHPRGHILSYLEDLPEVTATGEFKNNTCGVTARRQDVEREAVHPFLGPCLKSDRKRVCLSFLKHSPPSNIQLRHCITPGARRFHPERTPGPAFKLLLDPTIFTRTWTCPHIHPPCASAHFPAK